MQLEVAAVFAPGSHRLAAVSGGRAVSVAKARREDDEAEGETAG
jgi:hypothetical protein